MYIQEVLIMILKCVPTDKCTYCSMNKLCMRGEQKTLKGLLDKVCITIAIAKRGDDISRVKKQKQKQKEYFFTVRKWFAHLDIQWRYKMLPRTVLHESARYTQRYQHHQVYQTKRNTSQHEPNTRHVRQITPS